jgi:hypothetical protein
LTYESEDFCFALPVRERRASARERLSSYREPASRNLQDVHTETVREPVHTRTVSPSVHPRPASGGATNFFLASALVPPLGLATDRQRRHAMRPTDVCHPNELRAPAPRAFPAHCRRLRGADTPRSLGLRGVGLGDRMFHDTRDRFGGSSSRTTLDLYCLTASRDERGRFLPTVPMRSSLWHPCRDLCLSSRLTHFRGRCHLAVERDF